MQIWSVFGTIRCGSLAGPWIHLLHTQTSTGCCQPSFLSCTALDSAGGVLMIMETQASRTSDFSRILQFRHQSSRDMNPNCSVWSLIRLHSMAPEKNVFFPGFWSSASRSISFDSWFSFRFLFILIFPFRVTGTILYSEV